MATAGLLDKRAAPWDGALSGSGVGARVSWINGAAFALSGLQLATPRDVPHPFANVNGATVRQARVGPRPPVIPALTQCLVRFGGTLKRHLKATLQKYLVVRN